MIKEKAKKIKKVPKPKKSERAGEAMKEKKVATEEKEIIGGEPELQAEKKLRYYEGLGRRKTSIARVRLFTQGDKEFLVNKKSYQVYFPTNELWQIANSALSKMKCEDRFRVEVIARGGGIHSQAEAVRHGISRALVQFNSNFKKRLRRAGYLTRDPRAR